MVRVVLARPEEVVDNAGRFRELYMSHEQRMETSTPWEAGAIAAFETVHQASQLGDARAQMRAAAGWAMAKERHPRVDGYLLQLVVEALAGPEVAAASESALQGRMDVFTGEDKTSFSCAEFMRALHSSGGTEVERLWRGLELVVGVVSLYKRASDGGVAAIDGDKFRAAIKGSPSVRGLTEGELLSDEEHEELDGAVEAVWERLDVFLSAGLGAQVKLPEMLRVAIDTVPVDGSSTAHTWQTDDELNECEDCDTKTDAWCQYCESCQRCDELGNGHMCTVASQYRRVLRLAAAVWHIDGSKGVKRRPKEIHYRGDGATGLQLYQAVLKTTGQNCLIVEAIDTDSPSAKNGVEIGSMLCSCQQTSTVGLAQHEMLYLPLEQRPLTLSFVDCSLHTLVGDSRHSAREDIAKRKAAAKARERARERAKWSRWKGKVVVSGSAGDTTASLAFRKLAEPRFDSRKEPYNRPVSRDFTRKWAANFTAARALREQTARATKEFIGFDPMQIRPEAQEGKPTVGLARQIFSATRMVKPAAHIDRLDREYSQYDTDKKTKKVAEIDDFEDDPFDDVHERAHEVYLPRSLQDSMTRMPAEMEAVLSHGHHQRRTLKSLVSKKLRRYTSYGFDLNLTYIMPNIIAMGFPAEGREATYRNQIVDVQRFLNTRHPNAYKVYNLCSERNYPAVKFRHQGAAKGCVSCYPFDDHNPPTLNLIKDCCEDMQRWLTDEQDDDSRCCVVHCKAGKGRTGTIIAAYLLFDEEFDTAAEALDYFGHCRTLNAKGVTIPSQVRYVHYFERWLNSDCFGEIPDAPITLNKIRLIGVPDFAGDGSCTPYFVITKGYKDADGTEVEYDLRKKLEGGSSELQVEHVVGSEPYIDFDTELDLNGDIALHFLHKENGRGGDTKMCHMWLHTAFIHNDKVVIPKAHIDVACKDKHCKTFRSDFSIELHFDINHEAPKHLAHDHSTGYTVHNQVANDANAAMGPNLSADSATLLVRRTLHARRGEPAPSPRLVTELVGPFAQEAHQAVRKMKRRPGTPIDFLRRSLEFYAQDNDRIGSSTPTPLVIEAELALYVAEAFGGEGTGALVRARMMAANLTGCRFGWLGRRDKLFCHEVLPIIEQILDEKTELLWSQKQAAASIGEAHLGTSLQLVVGVAAFCEEAADEDAENGLRLNEEALRRYQGWVGDEPTAAELGAAWRAINADGMSWVTMADMLRAAVTDSASFSIVAALRSVGAAALEAQEAAQGV